jgi:3'(2'), 5'-bisphosphate nucleotidase
MGIETNQSRKKLIEELIKICLKSSKVIMDIYSTNFDVERKSDSSPVTIADKLSEEIILNGISKLEPGIEVIAEESFYEEGGKDIQNETFFLVDPLDGTREFIKKNGEFTINIALIENKKPTLGLILVPTQKSIYFSYNVIDSYSMNYSGEKRLIKVKNKNSEDNTLLYSRSSPSKRVNNFIKINNINNVINCGSSLKFCLLASGHADSYLRFDPCYEWDTAAGHAILLGAGGDMVNLDNTDFTYNKKESGYLNDSFCAYANQKPII